MLYRRVHHHLYAVHVAGEHRDDDALLRLFKQLLEGFPHLALAHGVARALHVGGIRHQQLDAAGADGSQALEVRRLSRHGRKVNLEVPRVHHDAHRRMNRQRAGARDGVVHVDEFHAEAARHDGIAGLHLGELHLVAHVMLLELEVHQRAGKPRGIDGRGNLPEHVRRGADVILMPMGYEKASHPVGVLL